MTLYGVENMASWQRGCDDGKRAGSKRDDGKPPFGGNFSPYANGYRWGQELAKRAAATALNDKLYEHYLAEQRAYSFNPLDREGWERSGRAGRARAHYAATGYMPGQYIGPKEETT